MRLLLLLLIAPFLILLLIPIGAVAIGIGAAIFGVVAAVLGALFGVLVAIVASVFALFVSIGSVAGAFVGKILFALLIAGLVIALTSRKKVSSPPARG